MLTLKTLGPELIPRTHTQQALSGGQTQLDPWGSLAGLARLTSELQFKTSNCDRWKEVEEKCLRTTA